MVGRFPAHFPLRSSLFYKTGWCIFATSKENRGIVVTVKIDALKCQRPKCAPELYFLWQKIFENSSVLMTAIREGAAYQQVSGVKHPDRIKNNAHRQEE